MMLRMPRTLSWFVWGAVVVAGSILSFEIWKQALEPTPDAVGRAPQIVQPSAERNVPAIITLTPAGGATAKRGPSPAGGGGLSGGSSPGASLAAGASGGAALLLSGVVGGTGAGAGTGGTTTP